MDEVLFATAVSPPHPGCIVREDCLPELDLTTGAAAEALGVSLQTLNKIINGRGSVAPLPSHSSGAVVRAGTGWQLRQTVHARP